MPNENKWDSFLWKASSQQWVWVRVVNGDGRHIIVIARPSQHTIDYVPARNWLFWDRDYRPDRNSRVIAFQPVEFPKDFHAFS